MEEKSIIKSYMKLSFKIKVILWVALAWIVTFIVFSVKYADFGGFIGSTVNHVLFSYMIGAPTGILIAIFTHKNNINV